MIAQQFINGNWVAAIDNGSIELINPATEEVIGIASHANGKDCTAAIDVAQEAFKTWSKTTANVRAEILKKAANYLRENISTIANDMVLESGKPLAEAKGEWMVAANLFEWYAEEGKRSYGKTIPTSRADKRSYTIWQPMAAIIIRPVHGQPHWQQVVRWWPSHQKPRRLQVCIWPKRYRQQAYPMAY